MEKLRTIKKQIFAQRVNMGGIMLDQALPVRGIDMIDPFILIHHWNDDMKGGKKQNTVGVGPHPHRGFAPVTFLFEGGILHQDSIGNSSIVYSGGTQWMHSGKGIVHSERPTKELAENGGKFELIQFWVNYPSKLKMAEPSYQPVQNNETPKIYSKDKKVEIGLVAGNYKGKKGPIKEETDLLLLRLNFEENGEDIIQIPNHFNALLYVLNGSLEVNNSSKIEDKGMIWFNNDGDGIQLKATKNTRAIILSGAPLNEPVATYGPFVMNTNEELMKAVDDYNSGKMGKLIEKFN